MQRESAQRKGPPLRGGPFFSLMRGSSLRRRSAPGRSGGFFVVVRVDLGVFRPLGGKLVLGEASVHRAGLDAGVAVDALVRVDVELLDRVVIGLVRRRVDAVDGANLDARVVLLAD